MEEKDKSGGVLGGTTKLSTLYLKLKYKSGSPLLNNQIQNFKNLRTFVSKDLKTIKGKYRYTAVDGI